MSPRTLSLLHLANLHLGVSTQGQHWLDSLIGDIEQQVGRTQRFDYFVVSGDVVDRGQVQAFSYATSVLSRMALAAGVPKDHIVICPGNHDLVRESHSRVAEIAPFERLVRELTGIDYEQNSIRWFPDDKIGFLILDAQLNSIGAGEGTERLATIRSALRTRPNDSLLCAVTHSASAIPFSPELSVRQKEIYTLFEEFAVQIVFDGGEGGDDWTTVETPRGRWVTFRCGAIGGEGWEAQYQPRTYQIIRLQGHLSVRADLRNYMEGIAEWRTTTPSRRLKLRREARAFSLQAKLPPPREVTSQERSAVLNALMKATNHDIEELMLLLEPAIRPFAPEEECKDDFLARLVGHFDRQNRLAVLAEALKRISGKDEYARLRIFISASNRDSERVESIARVLGELGHHVWLDKWCIQPGDSVSKAIEEGVRTADLLLLVVSPRAEHSVAARRELELFLSLNSRPRVGLIQLGAVALPRGIPSAGILRLDTASHRDVRAQLIPFISSLVECDPTLLKPPARSTSRTRRPSAISDSAILGDSGQVEAVLLPKHRLIATNQSAMRSGVSEELASRIGPDVQYIAIEGPPGSGKAALAHTLAKRLGTQMVLDIQDNRFLKSFYQGEPGAAFSAQMLYLADRFNKLRSIPAHVVTDFLFEKDKIYACLNLTDSELELYNQYYSMMREQLRGPDLVIYLEANVGTIQIRHSELNDPISNEYVAEVVKAYDYFFHHYAASDLLVVDLKELTDVKHFEGVLRRSSHARSEESLFMRAGGATA